MNPLRQNSWSPYVVGVAIGVLSWLVFLTADHPLGVSTSYENTAALLDQAVDPAATASNPYFQKRQSEGKPPRIDWEWMLVVGIFLGAYVSARLGNDRTEQSVPPLWRWRFGPGVAMRFAGAFAGGALMMFGARLAQGCTSGHGISGALQLALSSWIFVVFLFLGGIFGAFALYGKEGRHHV